MHVFDQRLARVALANGWVARTDGTVLLYYASSDTRMHVAVSDLDRLLDYVTNTPEDGRRSAASVQQTHRMVKHEYK